MTDKILSADDEARVRAQLANLESSPYGLGYAWSTIKSLLATIDQERADLVTLAKLAAPTPQFFNPLAAWEAQALRDRVLLAHDLTLSPHR